MGWTLFKADAPDKQVATDYKKDCIGCHIPAKSQELGPRKIRVNSLDPGMVETDGLRASGLDEGDFREETERKTPLGGIAQPGDIALAATVLAGDDARRITGQVIVAAGGRRM
jgi:3-oxoacyl-[acyl-carrier protein] reductase